MAEERRGTGGEDLACAELERQGWVILDRNYTCRVGEIDIVGRDHGTLVFVEVKERGDPSRGTAVEAVTPSKRRRVVRAAERWAAVHGESESRIRFDVFAIDHGEGGPAIRHDRGAFDADGR